MNDYYLFKIGQDMTAQRMAEADRARLARSTRAPATAARRSGRTRQAGRAGTTLGTLLHRVASF